MRSINHFAVSKQIDGKREEKTVHLFSDSNQQHFRRRNPASLSCASHPWRRLPDLDQREEAMRESLETLDRACGGAGRRSNSKERE